MDGTLPELTPHPLLPAIIAIGLLCALTPLLGVCISYLVRRRKARRPQVLPKSGLEDVADAARARMMHAQDVSQQIRLTVSGGLAAIGFFFICVAIGPLILKMLGPQTEYGRQAGLWPSTHHYDENGNEYVSEWQVPYSMFMFLIGPALSLMLLAVTPGDRTLVRCVSIASFFVFVLAFFFFLFLIFSSNLVTQILVAIHLLPFIQIARLSVPTFLCGKSAMTPRRALGRVWLALRIFLCAAGSLVVLVTMVPGSAGYAFDKPYGVQYEYLPLAVSALGMLICGAILRPSVRRSVHAKLGNLTLQGEARSAAAIAALVGGRDPSAALQHGIRNFRALAFTRLEEADLVSNSSSSGLYERTQLATLGSVDAFMSHSWHDDPTAKWDALTKWASVQPSPPLLWLDKACIDQERIDESLAALPVYLSGCKQLLVLVGPTYCGRLWCVMELFTFIQMGGQSERVTVRTTSDAGELIESQLATFDAMQSTCYKPEEKQRLLGIIEQAFGDFEVFNAAIRSVFAERGFSASSRKDAVRGSGERYLERPPGVSPES